MGPTADRQPLDIELSVAAGGLKVVLVAYLGPRRNRQEGEIVAGPQ